MHITPLSMITHLVTISRGLDLLEPLEAPVPEERAGELEESAVVLRLLVVADEDRPTLGEPGDSQSSGER